MNLLIIRFSQPTEMDINSLREDLERQMRSRSSTFDSGVPDDFPDWGKNLDDLL